MIRYETRYRVYQLKDDFKVNTIVNPQLGDEFTSSKWLYGWRYAVSTISLYMLAILSFSFSFYCVLRLLDV